MKLLSLFVPTALALALAAPSFGQTVLFDSLGPGDTFDPLQAFALGSTVNGQHAFSMMISGPDVVLTSITAPVYMGVGFGPFTMSVHEDEAGLPAPLALDSVTLGLIPNGTPDGPGSALTTFSFSGGATLKSGHTYWIAASTINPFAQGAAWYRSNVSIQLPHTYKGAQFGTEWQPPTIGVAAAMRVEVEPASLGFYFCSGDQSGAICPCFNWGEVGTGCANSTGVGANLQASGSLSVGADDLAFSLTGGPAGGPAMVFAATGNNGLGLSFGDGKLCTSGQVQRLGTRFLDASGTASWGAGLQSQGGWSSGDTRYAQSWYRDNAGPCGTGFNLSQGVRLEFLP